MGPNGLRDLLKVKRRALLRRFDPFVAASASPCHISTSGSSDRTADCVSACTLNMATVEQIKELRHATSTSELPADARDVTKPGAMNARTKPMILTEAMGNKPYLWNPVFNRGMDRWTYVHCAFWTLTCDHPVHKLIHEHVTC